MKNFTVRLLSGVMLCGLLQTGQAALNAVDPGPYTAVTGHFPHWYQDTQAVALDLCLSYAQSSRVPGVPGAPSYMCTILANPPIFTDTLPVVWDDVNFANTNFPDEAFYFSAGAAIDDGSVPDNQNTCLSYGAHIEAAFGSGVPAPNDQITFARIRIRGNVPAIGTYTVTHPYGVETFVATTANGGAGGCNGNNTDIGITRDIGIGAPGDFTGALAGDVGPFLRDPNGPYIEPNPTTSALETYIGDPNLTTPVTIGGVLTAVAGTPVVGGPNGNILRIQGPGVDVQTDLFAVSGKLFAATLPTPLAIERTDYSRGLLGNFQTDVFALAPFTATLDFTDGVTTTAMQDLDANGEFYGFDILNLSAPFSLIDVTAKNPPSNLDTTTSGTLVDLVTISSATYSLGSNVLNVVAASSDAFNPPTLTLDGLGLTGADAAGVTFPPVLLTIPPATVTVTSDNGGSDTEAVVLIP